MMKSSPSLPGRMQLLDKLRIVGKSKPTQRNCCLVKLDSKSGMSIVLTYNWQIECRCSHVEGFQITGCMIQNLPPIYSGNW